LRRKSYVLKELRKRRDSSELNTQLEEKDLTGHQRTTKYDKQMSQTPSTVRFNQIQRVHFFRKKIKMKIQRVEDTKQIMPD
jgi:hypothetical protein